MKVFKNKHSCDGGYFSAHSQIRRINREWIVLLTAQRALLLQIAHPAIAAGVDDHSQWREQPYRRLWRTLWLMNQIIFGRRQAAATAVKAINQRHLGVKGFYKTESNQSVRGYDAADSKLAWWVLATLIDSSLIAYEKWVRCLQSAERDQYLQECKLLAEFFGVHRDNMPNDFEEFSQYMKSMIDSNTLKYNSRSREMAQAILNTPPVLKVLFYRITVSCLPTPVRNGFGFQWDEEMQQHQQHRDDRTRNFYYHLPRLLRKNPISCFIDLFF